MVAKDGSVLGEDVCWLFSVCFSRSMFHPCPLFCGQNQEVGLVQPLGALTELAGRTGVSGVFISWFTRCRVASAGGSCTIAPPASPLQTSVLSRFCDLSHQSPLPTYDDKGSALFLFLRLHSVPC